MICIKHLRLAPAHSQRICRFHVAADWVIDPVMRYFFLTKRRQSVVRIVPRIFYEGSQ